MKKIINLNENILEKIIETSIKTYLNECTENYINEGVDFGKFNVKPELALKIVKQKLSGAINNGIIDPNALTVDNFGHVVYTRRLPAGVEINTRTFEVTQQPRRGGGRNNNEIPLQQYRVENPDAQFVPLVFGSNNNTKVTDSVRRIIARRYSISNDGAVLDNDRDAVVPPYAHGNSGCINFRAYDENGNEIFHGNTTIDALVKASFGGQN